MGSSYSALATTDDNDVIISSTERDICCHAVSLPAKSRPIMRPAVHLDTVNWLAPVRSGMVISCSSDKTIVLNNMDTGACVMRWRGHEREVTKVIYKHLGCKHFVLSASKDASIRLWQFNSPESCKQYVDHQITITALASLDDYKFVSGSRDGRINVWDLNAESRPLMNSTISRNLITHMEFEPLTQIIYQTSENGSLRLWDSRNLTLICEYPPKPYALLHCDICSTSTSCLTSSAGSENYGSELSLWDVRQRKLLREYHGHEGSVRCSVFLHQQPHVTWKQLLLSVSDDKTARIWNINTGVCMWTETVAAELNSCVGFADGSIAIGGGNSTLCDMRLLNRAGRPYLSCNSIQSNLLCNNSA